MDTIVHKWFKIPYTLHVTHFLSPKRPKATFILIHGIGNSAKAWEALMPLLPKNVRVIGIDLLGFGKSPRPYWAKYDARTQSRSVIATMLKLRLLQQPIIVGHSLGGLVAVEVAKRYPRTVKQLILCSPPFYRNTEEKRRLLQRDAILKDLYRRARKYPQTLETLSPLIVKLKLASKSLDINAGNMPSYVAALEASIVNQTSLVDAANLKLPITILYGSLDPVVIGSNIKKLAMSNTNIVAKKITTGHEIVGRYVKFIAKEMSESVSQR
jgi:pimeloyl-ACP methyl ester carboxylesterase